MLGLFRKLESTIPPAVADKVFFFADALGRPATKDETGNVLTTAVYVEVPATPTSLGVPGTMAYDATYLYLCVADDTWVRIEKDSSWV